MSPGGSAVQSVIRIRPLNQLMPSLPKSEEEPVEEFNHPISDDPYIPTILDPTYYPHPSVKEPEIHFDTSGETHIVEEKSIDQQNQEEPLNFVIGENENEDFELVIDEDFSCDVENDINVDNERNICLHIPLKKRGKFSCNNCYLQKELKNVY